MIDPQIDLSVIELPSELLIVDRYRMRPGVQDLFASAPNVLKARMLHYAITSAV